ncbi:hypothetical protein BUE80_DR008419 [Diplocarpon rosae]|nr:hypothetical protein BUE80_DR008419 [Diplocarpon rosae]
MPSSMLTSTLAVLAAAAVVSAHGHVQGVTVDGVYHKGWVIDYAYQPTTAPQTFGWAEGALDNGFVTPDQASTPDIICHKDATNGAISLPVSAGAAITVHWNTWADSHKGPVLDYLASCKGDCATVDKTTLEFFKIDEKGLEAGKWASEELLANNNSWAVTIPADVAPGAYVLRHEIIALHGAGSPNGAQLYPFCLNLEISGTGTATPAGTPGMQLYTPTDPGILVPGIYAPDLVYDIPGPAVYNSGAAPPAPPAAPAPGGTTPVASYPATTLSTAVRTQTAAGVPQTPAANPPAVNPPAVNPPAVSTPAANPPVVNPPAANPPAVSTPAANPPAVSTPAANPPVVNPPVVNPPAVSTPAATPTTYPTYSGTPEEEDYLCE